MPVTGAAQWPLPGPVPQPLPGTALLVDPEDWGGGSTNPTTRPQGWEAAPFVSGGRCLHCWPHGHCCCFTPTADDTHDLQVTETDRPLSRHARQGL